MKSNFYDTFGERSRRHALKGAPKGYKRRLSRMDTEDLPIREGNLAKRWVWDGKISDGNLAPLRRFLVSRVGRPWNEVYSEICQANPPGEARRAVLEFLDGFVEQRVALVKGEPWSSDLQYRIAGYGTWVQLYVHPETGLLEAAPSKKIKKDRPRHRPDRHKDRIILSDLEQYRLIGGVWYLLRFMEAGASCEHYHKDLILFPEGKFPDRHPVKPSEVMNRKAKLFHLHGANIVAVYKRQVDKRTMRTIRSQLG